MIQVIPAIDIIDGKCVRLTQGDYEQKKIYNEDPSEVAKEFEDAGIKRLHLVDLDGAKEKRIINHKVLEKIANSTKLIIDFGGGIQSDEDIQKAFDFGAKMITGGSIAVKNQEMFLGWLEKFGPEKIILGADAKDEMIAISGWQESTKVSVYDFIEEFPG
jgi:phosphoribosylformimino-5-aminoimidazole carboxamide ribotide isomerase